MPKYLLIWDFDGTLARREGMWSGAIASLVKRHRPDLDLPEETFRPHLQSGFPWHDWKLERHAATPGMWWDSLSPVIRHALSQGCAGSLLEEEAEAVVGGLRGEYLRIDAWRLFPDVMPFFTGPAAASYTHVILSNHVPELEELITALRIRHFFDAIFNSGLTGLEKPHPRAFRQVLDAYPEHRAIMIGDSFAADVTGASDAGIPSVLVRRHHPLATRFLATLEDLENLLAGITGDSD